MSLGLRARLLAAVAAIAIVASGLLPVVPAFADEPTGEPTSSPTADPTAEPTADPTAEPTADPTAEPTAEPTIEPTETATPSPTPSAAAATTISLTGTFTRYSTEDRLLGDEPDASPADDGTAVFTVPGSGFLRADVSQLPSGIAAGSATVRFAVPAGLVLSADQATAFQQLSTYSTDTAAIVATSVLPGRVSARSTPNVNQTPNTSAVHEVYAVLVSPSSAARGADQTEAKVTAALAGTSAYWSQQSGGTVSFHLAGTTAWYPSANSCATDAGSTALWNQAASVAASQLGYAAARNVHLVLFFSSTTNCGGSLGLGTIGWSANEGGASWVIGTDTPMAQGILSHELGHNLSLGHASWAQCSGSSPNYAGIPMQGCTLRPYGDLTDVMGYSQTGRSGGALSSSQAIRASIWPTSAYDNAPVGTTDYVLNAVSTNSGLRSVVIEDPYEGDRFFVEFRNYTDEDAPYASAGCGANSCVAAAPGVRVQRFQDDYEFVSFPGDDSYLLGRVVSGNYRINYTAGETFYAEGSSVSPSSQVKVEVVSITGNTATVRVTRPPLGSSPTSQVVRTDFVSIVPTVTQDARYRVGDTWTAMLGTLWSAETYSFQWYRNGVPISGATQASYTIAPADLNKGLRVSVTGSSTGAVSATESDPFDGTSYGPIVKGIYQKDQPGAVSIDNSGSQLQAVTSSWPASTTFSYQWFRGGSATTATTAISGATAAGYAPGAADVNQFIRLRVVATVPGYESTTRYSAASNYSLTIASGSITISGSPAIGLQLSAVNGITYQALGGTVTPTSFDYQWLRNGAVIAGATSVNYTPVSADFNTKLSVRVIAHAPGYVQHTAVSAPTAAIAAGAIAGSGALPTMVKVHDGNPGGVWTLTATLPSGSITEPGVAYAYQWFRDATAIAGATAAVYRPVAADYSFDLSVRVTVTKLNFATRILTSVPADYSVYADPGALTIDSDGTPAVGETLGAGFVTYHNADGGVAPVQSWQWYRNGVAIAGATGLTYELASADFNTAITFRVTSKVTGFLGLTVTSVATPAIAKGALAGTFDVPTVSRDTATKKLTAVLPAGSVSTAGVAYAYQWFRGSAAIAGATVSTYTLTAADYAALVSVKVTVTKLNYTTVVLPSVPVNYSVMPSTAIPVITGELALGAPLTVVDRTYTVEVGGSVVEAYQWYRGGVAIPAPLGTAAVYTPVTADLGKALTVRVTASVDGVLPAIATSAATLPVGTNTLEGWNDQDTVTVAVTGPATLTAMGTGITGPAPLTVTYQWYRGTLAVAGATKSTYTLTAADFAQTVWVRVTTSKATYTTIVKSSVPVDYSIQGAAPTITSSTDPWTAGAEVAVGPIAYTTKDGALDPTTIAYQWLRNGVAIAGATNFSYLTGSADYNTKLTVRITASEPGYVSRVVTTAATPVLAKGTIEGTLGKPTVSSSSSGLLSITIPAGTITTPATAPTYQWYRNAAAIAGATKATYQLTTADYGASVSVRITITKLNYVSAPLLQSDLVNYSVVADGLVTISGTGAIDTPLTANAPTHQAFGSPVTPTLTYQWLRGTVAIAGATGAEYLPQPADFGIKLSVRVTAVVPGAIASVSTATSAVAVSVGVWQGSMAVPDVTASPTGLLTVTVPSGAITTPAAVLTYQWYRNTLTPIAGATKTTYQLTAADYGATVWVRVTATKPRLDTPTRLLDSTGVNYSAIPYENVTITGTAKVGETLGVTTTTYNEGAVVPTLSYQWLRNGVAVAGATASTYVIASADLGTKFTVRVTAASPGKVASVYTTLVATPPVAKGDFTFESGGAVASVTASPSAVLTASLTGVVTPAVTLAYQWLRNGAAIAGATKSTFALTAADAGKSIRVKITVAKANMVQPSPVVESGDVDYTLLAANAPAELNKTTVKVTEKLTYAHNLDFTYLGDPVTPALSYQWLRNGVAIAGATAYEYYAQGADFGTKLSVRVTAVVPGLIPYVSTTTQTSAVGKGDAVQGHHEFAPTVSASPTGVLTATVASGAVQTPGAVLGYQWFRNDVAVAGATKATFTLTAADFGKTLFVRVTASMPNVIAPLVLDDSEHVDYSVVPAPSAVTISGVTKVDEVLSAGIPSYETAAGDPLDPVLTYQWFRGAVAIAGATASTYRTVAADYKALLKVRVTASVPGLVPSILTSGPTAAIELGSVVASGTPVVTLSAARVLTAALAPGTVTTTGTTLSYQWYRNDVLIAGATAATYTIAAADSDKTFKVAVSVNKLNLTSARLESPAVNYSMTADPHPLLTTNAPGVGSALSLVAPGYTSSTGDPLNPAFTYQWLRAGVAIAGATGTSYTPVVADLGKALTLRVVATQSGYLALTTSSLPTNPVANGVLVMNYAPVITGSWPSVLTAALPDGSVTEPGVTLAYQWYRGGVAITGATAASYTLSPTADLGRLISVKITVSKAGFISANLTSDPGQYTIGATGAVELGVTAPIVGDVVGFSALPDFTKDGGPWSPASGNLVYQWYLNGVAVTGAAGIGSTYTVVAANAGKTLTLRVTAKAPGYLPVSTVSAGAVIALP